MEQGCQVYVTTDKKVGTYKGLANSSGFLMAWVDFGNSDDLFYLSQLLDLSIRYKNSNIWDFVDRGILPKGCVIQDVYGNTLEYNGMGFESTTPGHIGFYANAKWKILCIDNKGIKQYKSKGESTNEAMASKVNTTFTKTATTRSTQGGMRT